MLKALFLACADAAVAPIVLALKRFGATLQDLPNLNAYHDKMQVCPAVCKHTAVSLGICWCT